MYNLSMSETIKFVFNQTYYYGTKKYQSGEYMEIPISEAHKWENVSFGNLYKPKGNKKKKEK